MLLFGTAYSTRDDRMKIHPRKTTKLHRLAESTFSLGRRFQDQSNEEIHSR
uniref:Uncharacterized protein n=1 Tax=Lepeophtheirus salmonis TaxID=72036 RepID=A0A0K2V178_LEPSM